MVKESDFVFEGRNKEYGAYRLRKKYPARVLTGALVATVSLIMLLTLPVIAEWFDDTPKVRTRTVVFTPLPEPPALPEAPPPRSGGKGKAEKKPAPPAKKEPEITQTPATVEKEDATAEESNSNGDESSSSDGTHGPITKNTGKTHGIEGARGEQGTSPHGNRKFLEIEYIRVPDAQALKNGALSEVKFKGEDEAEFQEMVRDGKVPSGKFIEANNQQIMDITNRGFLHLSHMQSFVLVNDSIAVNIRAIRKTGKKEIVLKDGKRIALQKEYSYLLQERLQAYSQAFSGDSIVFDRHVKQRKRYRYVVKTEAPGNSSSPVPTSAQLSDRIAGQQGNGLISGTAVADDGDEVGKKMIRIQRNRQIQDLQTIIARRKKEELLQKEQRDQFNFPRPYGTPDKTVKIDHTMMNFRNVAEVLQGGRVAGIMVSGDNIFIRSGGVTVNPETGEARGGLSLGAGEEPLFLLDGLPTSKQVIMSLPVSMIAAIDILKSPDNTAFYGSKGAHGVIAVFTRKASMD